MAQCSRGWAARCARATSARCRCACHGQNHGNPAARREGWFYGGGELTPARVFEPKSSVDYRRIKGTGQPAIVLQRIDGRAVANVPHALVVNSPTGFEYGYGGSGPADLALNILALFLEPPEAWRLHEAFKWQFIASLERNANHCIPAAGIRAWIEKQWQEEAEAQTIDSLWIIPFKGIPENG
jgi:hypothetical protein